MLKFINLSLFVIYLCTSQINCDCVWYGECGASGRGDNGHYNCKYTGEAKLQTDPEFLDLFKVLCPHLYNGNETRTCCDIVQLHTFNKQLSVPKQLMTRCPACFINFKAFLCDFTCSPNHSEFMVVTNEQKWNGTDTTKTNSNMPSVVFNDDENESNRVKRDLSKKETKTEVVSLNYYVTDYYVTNMYNSCK